MFQLEQPAVTGERDMGEDRAAEVAGLDAHPVAPSKGFSATAR